MISVKNLYKSFNGTQAVNDLSFDIIPGDVVGFLGPNGAGKSTTMKMLTGFLLPTSGDIFISNLSLEKSALEIKKKIGYLPEGAPAYGDMTPLQFLNFIAQVRGYKGAEKAKRIEHVVRQVELQEVLDKPIDNLSKGFKRRVGLAQALIHDPEILILDEPTDGLDPNQKHQVRELIKNLSKDKIVIISTHILEEVTAVCNRVMEEDLETGRVTLFPKPGAEILHLVTAHAQRCKLPIDSLYVEQGRLDEVFRHITQEENA